MRISIVDDDPQMRLQLSEYIKRLGTEKHTDFDTTEFPCGDVLLEDYHPDYDVIIFDIDMPGTNGMDTARKVRAMDEQVVILFVTNIAQYAINGYEVGAVDYVIKPIGYFDFAMKFERALKRVVQKQVHQLVVESTDGLVWLKVADIFYVEVLGHYLVYHTSGKNYTARGSMKESEETMHSYHFSRCHKSYQSYLINLACVENIRSSEALVGGNTLPLGRAYKDTLSGEYLQYLRG